MILALKGKKSEFGGGVARLAIVPFPVLDHNP